MMKELKTGVAAGGAEEAKVRYTPWNTLKRQDYADNGRRRFFQTIRESRKCREDWNTDIEPTVGGFSRPEVRSEAMRERPKMISLETSRRATGHRCIDIMVP
ncbi:hypothetical protein KM043_016691 [Ampulex compressa]|nr:hypothetical protein KM043_016691 [Ampulex compressa]